MIKLGDIPELMFIDESQISMIKTYPEEKSNRMKIIIRWQSGEKDFIFATEEEVEYLEEQYNKVKKKRRSKIKKQKDVDDIMTFSDTGEEYA